MSKQDNGASPSDDERNGPRPRDPDMPVVTSAAPSPPQTLVMDSPDRKRSAQPDSPPLDTPRSVRRKRFAAAAERRAEARRGRFRSVEIAAPVIVPANPTLPHPPPGPPHRAERAPSAAHQEVPGDSGPPGAPGLPRHLPTPLTTSGPVGNTAPLDAPDRGTSASSALRGLLEMPPRSTLLPIAPVILPAHPTQPPPPPGPPHRVERAPSAEHQEVPGDCGPPGAPGLPSRLPAPVTSSGPVGNAAPADAPGRGASASPAPRVLPEPPPGSTLCPMTVGNRNPAPVQAPDRTTAIPAAPGAQPEMFPRPTLCGMTAAGLEHPNVRTVAVLLLLQMSMDGPVHNHLVKAVTLSPEAYERD
ncbi:hypothetical protein CALCODRAFT_488880, partial [Calocera cornea HHB12733]